MPIGANFTAIWRILPWSRAWGQGMLELHRFGKCGNPNPNDNIFVYFRRPNSISKRNKSTQQTRNYYNLPKYTSTYPSMYRIYIYIYLYLQYIHEKCEQKQLWRQEGLEMPSHLVLGWSALTWYWPLVVGENFGIYRENLWWNPRKTYGKTLGKPMAKPKEHMEDLWENPRIMIGSLLENGDEWPSRMGFNSEKIGFVDNWFGITQKGIL